MNRGQREGGDGLTETEIRRTLGLAGKALRRDLAFLARLKPRPGGLLGSEGLDAYMERGRAFYFGPLVRVRLPGLNAEEKSALRGAAGFFSGSFRAEEAAFLRAFAGPGASPRGPSPEPKARVALEALAVGRLLIRPGGERLQPLALTWYRGHPCLEVRRLKHRRREASRFLLRLDRFPPCRLGPPSPAGPPARRPSRLTPGVRGKLELSGQALRLNRDQGGGRKMTMLAGSREELLRRVLRLGSEARVLGPAWLAAAVRRRALEFLAAQRG